MSTYTWIEDNSSRSAHIVRLGRKAQSTYVKSWKIFGTSDDVAVHQDVNTTIAAGLLYWQYPGQPENRLHVDHYTLEYLGDDAWQLSVTYVKEGAEDSNQPDPLKRSRSFDTSGGTAHYTQAIVKKLPNDGGFDLGERRYPVDSAPDQQGAIGVDGNSVNGVDVVVPALQWTETYDVPTAYITSTYIKQLSTLTGSVNDAAFRTFKAGEVLFLGASGAQEWDSQKGDGPWSLTFK
ncbi:MAG: hypothetical protein EBQ89_00310, partial [Alphaproteobacteria bacterium]|nr:hypothetical protein [Alphaproteobacteria bacterium]